MDNIGEIATQRQENEFAKKTFDFELFPKPNDGQKYERVTLKHRIGGGHVSDVYEGYCGNLPDLKPVAVKMYTKRDNEQGEEQISIMSKAWIEAERQGIPRLAMPRLIGWNKPSSNLFSPDNRLVCVMELLRKEQYVKPWDYKDKYPGGVIPVLDVLDVGITFLDTVRVLHEIGRRWTSGDRKMDDIIIATDPLGLYLKITDWDVQGGFGSYTYEQGVELVERLSPAERKKEDTVLSKDTVLSMKMLGGLLEAMVVPNPYLYATKRFSTVRSLNPFDANLLTRVGYIPPRMNETTVMAGEQHKKEIFKYERLRNILDNGTSLILGRNLGGLEIGELITVMAQGEDSKMPLSLEVAKAEFLQIAMTIWKEADILFKGKPDDHLTETLNVVNNVISNFWKSEESAGMRYDNYWKGRRLPKPKSYILPENFPREYAKEFIEEGDLFSLYRLQAQIMMEMRRRTGEKSGFKDRPVNYKQMYDIALNDVIRKHQWTNEEIYAEYKRRQRQDHLTSLSKFRDISERLFDDITDKTIFSSLKMEKN